MRAITAITTSERSPGVMTAIPSRSRSSMLGRHAGHQHAERLAVEQRRVSTGQRAAHHVAQFGHRQRDQQQLLGQHT